WHDDFTLCAGCNDAINSRHVCPECDHAIVPRSPSDCNNAVQKRARDDLQSPRGRDNTRDALVRCRRCHRWMHSKCLGIADDDVLFLLAQRDPDVRRQFCRECRLRSLAARCHAILDMVERADRNRFFWVPVKESYAPDYYQLIKTPLDLRTLRQLVDGLAFPSAAQFRAQLNLMWRNSRAYNVRDEFVLKTTDKFQLMTLVPLKLLERAWDMAQLLRHVHLHSQLPTTVVSLFAASYATPAPPFALARVAIPANGRHGAGLAARLRGYLLNQAQQWYRERRLWILHNISYLKLDDVRRRKWRTNLTEGNTQDTLRVDLAAPLHQPIVPRRSLWLPLFWAADQCDSLDNTTAPVDVCAACGSDADASHLLVCADCGETVHDYCLHGATGVDTGMRRKELGLPAPIEDCFELTSNGVTLRGEIDALIASATAQPTWRCTDCAVCDVCGRGDREQQLAQCECCERWLHCDTCLLEPLTAPPSGPFRCEACARCRYCHIALQAHFSRGVCDACVPNMPACTACGVPVASEGMCKTCKQKQRQQQQLVQVLQPQMLPDGRVVMVPVLVPRVNNTAMTDAPKDDTADTNSDTLVYKSPLTLALESPQGRQQVQRLDERVRHVYHRLMVGLSERDASAEDKRQCMLCFECGHTKIDPNDPQTSIDRLVPLDWTTTLGATPARASYCSGWVHAACLYWSSQVSFSPETGIFEQYEHVLALARSSQCAQCESDGGTVQCACGRYFHLACLSNGRFDCVNRRVTCHFCVTASASSNVPRPNGTIRDAYAASRRLIQVQSPANMTFAHQFALLPTARSSLLREGTLRVLSLGDPQQLTPAHVSSTHVFVPGYTAIRRFWSVSGQGRTDYLCCVLDSSQWPRLLDPTAVHAANRSRRARPVSPTAAVTEVPGLSLDREENDPKQRRPLFLLMPRDVASTDSKRGHLWPIIARSPSEALTALLARVPGWRTRNEARQLTPLGDCVEGTALNGASFFGFGVASMRLMLELQPAVQQMLETVPGDTEDVAAFSFRFRNVRQFALRQLKLDEERDKERLQAHQNALLSLHRLRNRQGLQHETAAAKNAERYRQELTSLLRNTKSVTLGQLLGWTSMPLGADTLVADCDVQEGDLLSEGKLASRARRLVRHLDRGVRTWVPPPAELFGLATLRQARTQGIVRELRDVVASNEVKLSSNELHSVVDAAMTQSEEEEADRARDQSLVTACTVCVDLSLYSSDEENDSDLDDDVDVAADADVIDTVPANQATQIAHPTERDALSGGPRQQKFASSMAARSPEEIARDTAMYKAMRRLPPPAVCRSRIHGCGLFATRDIKAHHMIIEYVGEVIRTSVADKRERVYERIGIGSCYMFRLDRHHIIDATLRGSVARFINHSCDPNAYSRVVEIDGRKKICIFSRRDIARGEEQAVPGINVFAASREDLQQFVGLLMARISALENARK
ncbi:MAG: hypothetical protein MHM6MM_004754, partial [Cercozoa sp. M6MM]